MHLNSQLFGSSEFIHHRDIQNSPNASCDQHINSHHFIQHSSNYNENFNLKRKSPHEDLIITNGNDRIKEINLITSPATKRISTNNNQTFVSPPIQPKLISPLLQIPLASSYNTYNMPPPQSVMNHHAPADLISNSAPPVTNNQSLIKINKQSVPFNTNLSNKYVNNSNNNNYPLNTHQSQNNQYQSTGLNQPVENISSHLNTPNLMSFSSNTNNKTNNQMKQDEIGYMKKIREKEKNFSGCNF